MIMKAVMMIAGRGTRLQPLTDYVPKCCLPVAGIPLMHIWLKKLQDAGICDVLLNPSWGIKHVKRSIMSFPIGSLKLTLRPEKEPIGTAQTLLRSADWIGDDSFLVIYGDVLTDIDLKVLMKIHNRKKAMLTIQTYTTHNPKWKGIVKVDEKGWASEFQEKPENPSGNLAFSGIFVAKPEFLSHIDKRDFEMGPDVFAKIVNLGNICFVYHDPEIYFKDIGTIPDYLSCQGEWKKLTDRRISHERLASNT